MARSVSKNAIDLALIIGAAAMLASLGVAAFASVRAVGGWWWIPLAVVLGVSAADFATGAVHWFCDRFFSEGTPLIGPVLIRPFREHHVDPQAMVQHGALELHANSCMPVVAALALGYALPWTARDAPFSSVCLFFFLLTSAGTNQFHKWAHASSRSLGVRWLQRHGLILSPERHTRHHSGGFRQSYCMTTGWLNPLLDRIDFFPRLERRIRALAGRAAR